ncbi:hypothetical protein [Pedobacter rhodius]|uniref:Uncharacterized protein n=1 Tax=Pedobacter rhodius TaxID=3004098 RepID=A0ABT4L215_9SPHI|nr:hypothetical protein [Pedobacter sp. SJ11]MCZ4224986.1 hypothetical protein [Pedobacter sp. SJ11]
MVCFFAFASEDRHVFASNLFLRTLADLYSIFQFPTHTFLFSFLGAHLWLYFLGLVFNCAFYAFIIEFGIAAETTYKENKKKQETEN